MDTLLFLGHPLHALSANGFIAMVMSDVVERERECKVAGRGWGGVGGCRPGLSGGEGLWERDGWRGRIHYQINLIQVIHLFCINTLL